MANFINLGLTEVTANGHTLINLKHEIFAQCIDKKAGHLTFTNSIAYENSSYPGIENS